MLRVSTAYHQGQRSRLTMYLWVYIWPDPTHYDAIRFCLSGASTQCLSSIDIVLQLLLSVGSLSGRWTIGEFQRATWTCCSGRQRWSTLEQSTSATNIRVVSCSSLPIRSLAMTYENRNFFFSNFATSIARRPPTSYAAHHDDRP